MSFIKIKSVDDQRHIIIKYVPKDLIEQITFNHDTVEASIIIRGKLTPIFGVVEIEQLEK